MNRTQIKYYGLLLAKLGIFIFAFLVCLQLMIVSFKLLNASVVEQILIATANPFVGLFIGLLITALIHSSSTITSMIVAIVASGTITLESAVFMVMGANIGTTVTSTMVSLGHFGRKKEFRKAIAAATVHDFFNILTTCILFPLEYYFGLLSGLAKYITGIISANHSFGFSRFFGGVVSNGIEPLALFILNLLGKSELLGLLVGISGLFLVLFYFSNSFKGVLTQKSPNPIEKYLLGTPLQSLICGFVVTALVQSSTVVTSLIVPFVANNKLSIQRIFPFIMGANIGTTLTALIASISKSDAALSIALTHLLFNLIGTLLIFPFASIRNIPVAIARGLGKATLRNRLVGLGYLVLTFFVVPFLLIYFTKGKIHIKQYTYIEEAASKAGLTKAANDEIKNKFFYKQITFKEYRFEDENQQPEILVIQKGDSILLNRQVFRLKEKGFCWQGQDSEGKYAICIEDIKQNMQINESLRFAECFVFRKTYYNPDLYSQRIYFATKANLILKREIINQKNKLVGLEELISIVK
jgi:solute carrier family 34 (sodium-dependent phosphate cotransporter)